MLINMQTIMRMRSHSDTAVIERHSSVIHTSVHTSTGYLTLNTFHILHVSLEDGQTPPVGIQSETKTPLRTSWTIWLEKPAVWDSWTQPHSRSGQPSRVRPRPATPAACYLADAVLCLSLLYRCCSCSASLQHLHGLAFIRNSRSMSSLCAFGAAVSLVGLVVTCLVSPTDLESETVSSLTIIRIF